jgi:hypothetical protein
VGQHRQGGRRGGGAEPQQGCFQPGGAEVAQAPVGAEVRGGPGANEILEADLAQVTELREGGGGRPGPKPAGRGGAQGGEQLLEQALAAGEEREVALGLLQRGRRRPGGERADDGRGVGARPGARRRGAR